MEDAKAKVKAILETEFREERNKFLETANEKLRAAGKLIQEVDDMKVAFNKKMNERFEKEDDESGELLDAFYDESFVPRWKNLDLSKFPPHWVKWVHSYCSYYD